MAKKELLSKMKMPAAPSAKKDPMLDVEELDLDEVGTPEEMPMEGTESPAEEGAELSHLSDDDLLAELKKRGFEVEGQEVEPEEMDMGEDEAAEEQA